MTPITEFRMNLLSCAVCGWARSPVTCKYGGREPRERTSNYRSINLSLGIYVRAAVGFERGLRCRCSKYASRRSWRLAVPASPLLYTTQESSGRVVKRSKRRKGLFLPLETAAFFSVRTHPGSVTFSTTGGHLSTSNRPLQSLAAHNLSFSVPKKFLSHQRWHIAREIRISIILHTIDLKLFRLFYY